jgi:hypothetical protein
MVASITHVKRPSLAATRLMAYVDNLRLEDHPPGLESTIKISERGDSRWKKYASIFIGKDYYAGPLILLQT